jgi:hypothetical protein
LNSAARTRTMPSKRTESAADYSLEMLESSLLR